MTPELEQLHRETKIKMNKTVEICAATIKKIRTGRPDPDLIANLMVDYYGQPTALNQIATITTLDGRALGVSPWDKSAVVQIEQCLRQSDLGLNPATTSDLIRIPFPQLTEETRKSFGKQVEKEGESSKISIRNIRRDSNGKVRDMLKNDSVNQDESRQCELLIQQETDAAILKITKLIEKKKQDLMQI